MLFRSSGQCSLHARPLSHKRRPLLQINPKHRRPSQHRNKYASATRSLAEDAGLQLRDVQVEVREWSSAFTLVRENIGVTLVPEMTLPSQLQGLRVVPVKPRIDREFALVAATNKPPSAAVQALIGMLAKK